MTGRGGAPGSARAVAVTVGIDLGGTGTRLVALDGAGAVHARHSVATCHEPAIGASRLVAGLTAQIRDVAADAVLDAVGVGASGPVDARGIIRNDDTLPAYSHIPLTELMSAELNVPCAIGNDAVAAAVGENTYGAGQHSPVLLAITLGTGVGVALLIDNAAYRGSDGVNPEAGHIPVPGPPAPCYCGLETCWEQLASRTALEVATGPATAELAALATAGDQRSRHIFDRYGEHVGIGVAALTTIFRPARVVLCGSVARYLPLLRPGLDRARTRTPPFSWTPPVVAAELGEYSGAIGAAVLARSQLSAAAQCSDRP
jgi:glucokinase